MIHELKIYGKLVSAHQRGQMSYRKSFLLEFTGVMLVDFADLVAIFFFFQNIPAVKGWSLWEVVYLYGLTKVSFSVARLLLESMEKVPHLIRMGTFDLILIRPLPPILQIAPESFRLHRFGHLLEGVFALAIAFWHLDIVWDFRALGVFALAFFCMLAIYSGLFIANAAACIWTVQSSELFSAFTYGGTEMGKFPVSIYRPWMQRLFIFIVPLGLAGYFPSLILLNKSDVMGWPRGMVLLAPLLSAVFLLACRGFWKHGLKHYQSTGS